MKSARFTLLSLALAILLAFILSVGDRPPVDDGLGDSSGHSGPPAPPRVSTPSLEVAGFRPDPEAAHRPMASMPFRSATQVQVPSGWVGSLVADYEESVPERGGYVRRHFLLQRPLDGAYIQVDEWTHPGRDGSATALKRREMAANRVLVEPGADSASLVRWAEARGWAWEVVSAEGGVYALTLPEPRLHAVDQAMASLPFPAEPDYVIRTVSFEPNDPSFQNGEQWALRNLGQSGGTPGADISAESGWAVTTDASSVVVAVIDSGARLTHQDLAGNLWINPGEIAGNGIDDDGNGYADDVHGINAIGAGSGLPMDDNGHGTHLAGVIGAVGDNGVGGTGVAWSVRLMILKFIAADGTGFTSNAIKCVDYARQKGAQVITASWVSGSFSQGLKNSLSLARDAGIIVVSGAGNNASNIDVFPVYPAAYNLDNLIAVAATNRQDQLAASSSFGPLTVDLAAPGVDLFGPSRTSDASYEMRSGTSAAAGIVSGMVALAIAAHPAEDYRTTVSRIVQGVDPLPSLAGKVASGGRANLASALTPTAVDIIPSLTSALVPIQATAGEMVTLAVAASGSEPFTYVWRKNGVILESESGSSLVFPSVNPGDGGTYSVTVSNAAGSAFSEARLTVLSPVPELGQALEAEDRLWLTGGAGPWQRTTTVSWDGEDSAASGTIGAREESILTTTVTGPGYFTFRWKVDSEPGGDWLRFFVNGQEREAISGSAGWELVAHEVPAGTHTLRWTYSKDASVSVGADKGYVDAFTWTPDASLPPLITTQPMSQTVAVGGTAVFSVGVLSARPVTYQWFKGEDPIPGADESVLTLSPVALENAGEYSVVVLNDAAVSTSSAVALLTVVVPTAPAIVSDPQGAVVSQGSYFSLSVVASGTAPFTYQWLLGALPLPDSNRPVYAFEEIAPDDAGLYSVTVTNATLESATSAAAAVQVISDPARPLISQQPAPVVVVVGGAAQFSGTATGSPAPDLQWFRDGVAVDGAIGNVLEIPAASLDDDGFYILRASNPIASAWSRPARLLVLPTDPGLAAALDNSQIPWSSEGALPWFAQTSVSSDGVDAARSGAIGDNAESRLVGWVTGPGVMRFSWKVSSEEDFDFLSFRIDDLEQGSISGDVDWQEAVFGVPAGLHQVAWVYSKDSGLVSGQDAGWVDQVVYESLAQSAPAVVVPPEAADALPGEAVVFSVVAAGPGPIQFQWVLGDDDLDGEIADTLVLPSVSSADAGPYRVRLSNAFGSTLSAPALLTVFDQPDPLAYALNSDLDWVTTGDAAWRPQTQVTRDGVAALRAGAIDHGQSSVLSTSVTGPGTLVFWWKVSSEAGFDFLQFQMGAQSPLVISGETDWLEVEVEVPAGTHSLVWTYSKDEDVSVGQDTGWLDLVSFSTGLSYETWAAQRFTAEELLNDPLAAPEADFDGDGLSNFAEYALGTEPKIPDSGVLSVRQESLNGTRYLVLSYPEALQRVDVWVNPEASTGFSQWGTLAVTVHEVSATATQRWLEAWVEVPASGPVTLRLSIQGPQIPVF